MPDKHALSTDGFVPSKIQFPSDGVTVRNLKQLFPRDLGFSWEYRGPRSLEAMDELCSLIHVEQEYAAQLFCAATNSPIPEVSARVDAGELAGMLESSYLQFGIASGKHAAAELVRSIDRQVASQIQGLSQ